MNYKNYFAIVLFINVNELIYAEKLTTSCVNSPRVCSDTKYRSFDGSCNNILNPESGMAETRYARLIHPNYGDGISSVASSKSGKPLPNARKISLILYPQKNVRNIDLTLNAMQYGQLVTHDIALTLLEHPPNDCCTENGQNLPKKELPSYCLPIDISTSDPDYSKGNQTCMGLVRTTTDIDRNCSYAHKPADQLSEVSHYLDLSLIYGTNEKINKQIRENKGGRIRVERRNGQDWPISSENAARDCPIINPKERCYFGIDSRFNQNLQLTTLEIVYIRNHNKITHILSELNPHWDDEKLFQEARKINIAVHQHITYKEYLPTILDLNSLYKHSVIYHTKNHFINDYDCSIDANVYNEHSNGAFRFFHSQIEGHLRLFSEDGKPYNSVRLSDWFFNPKFLEIDDNFDGLVRSLSYQPEMAADRFHDKEVTLYLFRTGMFGFDLKALDIQRSRDCGLASYNDYRMLAGLKRAKTFEDFEDVIPKDSVMKLKSLYEYPDDVDMIVGGSLEDLLPGAQVGPTFHYIILRQFLRTRIGDRFFYENGYQDGSFTLEQLNEIRNKATSALLFCENGRDIENIPLNTFRAASEKNKIVPCKKLPSINFNLWKEEGPSTLPICPFHKH